jgi:hypothetical protein
MTSPSWPIRRGRHVDFRRILDAPGAFPHRHPRWPEGTRRYVAYRAALTAELKPFASGEAPYYFPVRP